MIRTIKVLFCEEDHGSGDRTFPDLMDLDTRMFIDTPPTAWPTAQARQSRRMDAQRESGLLRDMQRLG